MQKANVIVCGKTGAGKSTLINSVLGQTVATEGVGACVRQQVTAYAGIAVQTQLNFCLYDTEGFELDAAQRQNSIEEVKQMIRTCLERKSDDFIHAIWYCINVMGSRVEEQEYKIVHEIIAEFQVPVVLVLTQAIDPKRTQEIKDTILRDQATQALLQEGKIVGVMPILARRYQIFGEQYVESVGLEELERKTFEVAKRSALNAYRKKIDLMEQKAKKYTAAYIGTTVVSGATPIPFADSAVLIPVQVTMLLHINKIFEIEISEHALKELARMVLGVGGATVVGKTIVGNVFKFLPGVGSIVGGAISATVAGTLTTALAKAYIYQAKKYKMQQIYHINENEHAFVNTVLLETKDRL